MLHKCPYGGFDVGFEKQAAKTSRCKQANYQMIDSLRKMQQDKARMQTH